MSKEPLKTDIVSVGDLLQYNKLSIPLYQRPYKWTIKNVNQLIQDILAHQEKSAYRLGTVVIHEDKKGFYNIVDGQQRTITLSLIAHAVINQDRKYQDKHLNKIIQQLSENLFDPEFSNEISKINIQNNYKEIERLVARMDEKAILFLFNKCEFIQFVLSGDVSEAFQFFDSQNARGKDLVPHDLLKAYHLREFSDEDESLKTTVVETWESMETEDLVKLFGEYLFRIKGWSKGNSSRYFSKNDVGLFKGINIHEIENFPYTQLMRITHFYMDHYNNSYERKIDQNKKTFPFQLDQTIINGRRFFEMITHYKKVLDDYKKSIVDDTLLNHNAKEIINTINNYDKYARSRTGDQYVRTLFDCIMIYYIDKFGYKDISRAIEKLFIWSYSLRLKQYAVQMSTMDNYVKHGINMFRIIKDAVNPEEVLSISLPSLEAVRSSKTTEIESLFKILKYHE